jgi:uncharacterized protein YrzB (UPF0473 family)
MINLIIEIMDCTYIIYNKKHDHLEWTEPELQILLFEKEMSKRGGEDSAITEENREKSSIKEEIFKTC